MDFSAVLAEAVLSPPSARGPSLQFAHSDGRKREEERNEALGAAGDLLVSEG